MAESWYDVGPRYSYLGVPAPAGVNDWREDGRLPPRAETEKCSVGACPQLGVGGGSRHQRLVRKKMAPILPLGGVRIRRGAPRHTSSKTSS